MKADLTRDTFRAEQRFARLIHPQGHVTLDAELNEQAQIQLHRDRTTAVDVIGPSGTPNGSGFQLVASPNKLDLLVLPGNYYADGRLVEAVASPRPVSAFPAATIVKLAALTLDGRPLTAGEWLEIAAPGANTHRFQITAIDAANRQVTVGANDVGPAPDTSPLGRAGATVRRIPSYVFQPDWPRPSETAWPAPPALPSLTLASGTYGAYLEVFAHHVADLSDPLLREVALGGIDGASREQTAWQVRLRRLGPVGTVATCAQAVPPAPARWGTVAARAKKPATGTNPCIIDPAALYRRLENQLYRVEIHQGGTLGVDAGITFKFSRDNGSVVVRWTGSTASTITVASTGRDGKLGLAPGDWIELVDDQRELSRTPGTLVQIETIEGTTINLKPGTSTGSTAIADFAFHPRVRRWDHVGPSALAVVRPATNDGYLALEDGVEVRFDDGTYATGDYWIVPARTITGDVEWPRDLDGLPIAQPSRGGAPIHVGLAIVEWSGSVMRVLGDCRAQFPPLTHICAKDVCLDDNPCDRGWTTVQQAIDDLCHEDNLVHHNQHLHGWGVVCGLQVNCMTDDYAQLHKLARPREWIIVRDGYAIHPTGSDIILESAAHDQITAIELGDLAVAAGVVKRDPASGAIPDTSVSLWVDKDRSFHVDAYDPTKPQGWQQLLDGTILSDIYNDCILKVIDFFKSQLTPGANEGLVGPTAKRVIAVVNLLWQLINQANGSHVYLSGEPNPATEPADKEDAILRALFDGLRKLLQSKCFCAMFDDLQFPSYDVYRADLPGNAPHPTTIFGQGLHTRIRVHPRQALAFTCGNGGQINVYDLTAQKLVAAVDFPISGAEVQDVAFGPIGNEIYAIAWIGDAQVDSVFAVGSVNANGTIAWTGNQVQCHLKLVTLATSELAPGVVYAAARGLGVYPFSPGALTPTPTPTKAFHATGHLVAAGVNGKAMLYAGSHTTDTNPVAFNEILGIDVKAPTAAIKFALPPDVSGAPGIGHDDLAVALSAKNGVASLYAIIDAQSSSKRLVAWDLGDPLQASATGAAAKQITSLGESMAGRVAYSAAGNWSLVTYEDGYLGKAYRPGQTALEPGLHPLQIGPVSIATDVDGRTFYVLELVSHTITVVPAIPTTQAPWVSTIDVGKLQQYRWAAIVVFLKMLGRFVQYLKDCICDHLMVNCPDPAGKKVYLADIAFKDGKVYQICNFHHRRYVHTFPTVEYWMSFVPILPVIKLAVEKACCSVLAGIFDQFAPPQNVASAKADKVSVTMLHHGLTFAKDLQIGSQIKAKRSQLVSTALLGKLSLSNMFARPSPGNATASITSTDVVNRSPDAATAAAKDKGILVRNVTVSNNLDATVKSVFSTPRVNAGDTVDLLTDNTGRVIGMVKASPTVVARTAAVGAAAAPAASTEDVAAMRQELAAMRDAHAQQAATIAKLQASLADVSGALARLRP